MREKNGAKVERDFVRIAMLTMRGVDNPNGGGVRVGYVLLVGETMQLPSTKLPYKLLPSECSSEFTAIPLAGLRAETQQYVHDYAESMTAAAGAGAASSASASKSKSYVGTKPLHTIFCRLVHHVQRTKAKVHLWLWEVYGAAEPQN